MIDRRIKSIGELIRKVSQRQKWDNKLSEAKLVSSWEEIMGKTIARHTTSSWMQRGKLYLKFDNAALRQELLFSKDQVVKRINEALEKDLVKELVLM